MQRALLLARVARDFLFHAVVAEYGNRQNRAHEQQQQARDEHHAARRGACGRNRAMQLLHAVFTPPLLMTVMTRVKLMVAGCPGWLACSALLSKTSVTFTQMMFCQLIALAFI